ncbi:MAG: aldose 1-epimerase family protein [Clostridia bacterium]|nr:aldose 1-epimerase family protein [Clostridia bacterium]
MITLKNETLTALISETGAEVKSLSRAGEEFIWEGDPEIWKFSAPMVFPICGALKDGKFIHRGKEYALQKHGFARTSEFSVSKLSEEEAVFTLAATDETRAVFPFEFELRVIYTLEGERLAVRYEVENKGFEKMYFSLGSHEAYKTPEGIEEYDVIFDEPVSLAKTVIEDALTTEKTVPVLKNSSVLPLYHKSFENDALLFRDVAFRAATLKNRVNGRGVRVEFPDMRHMLLWHVKKSPYMCIEPWDGLPDAADADGRIENKLDVTELEAGKIYKNVHFITPIPRGENK